MADNNNRTPDDIMNDIQGGMSNDQVLKQILDELRDMNAGIDNMERAFAASGGYGDPRKQSQSNMTNMFGRRNERGNVSLRGGFNRSRGRKGGTFLDNFEDELWKGLVGSDLKNEIGMIMNNFSKALGVSIEDIPAKFGEDLGKRAVAALQNTELGKTITSKIQDAKGWAFGKLQTAFDRGTSRYDQAHGTDFRTQFGKIFTEPLGNSAAEAEAEKSEEAIGVEARNPFDTSQSDATLLDYVALISANTEILAERFGKSSASLSESDVQAAEQDPFSDIQKKIKNIKDMMGKSKQSGSGSLGSEGDISDIAQNVESAEGSLSTGAAEGGSDLASAEGAQIGEMAMSEGAGAAAAEGAAAEGAGAAAAESGMLAAGEAAGAAVPVILIVMVALKKLKQAIGPAIEAFKEFKATILSTAMRDQDARKKRDELENQRLKANWETLIKQPFEVLQDAAQKFYDVWDNNLRKINATQGYSKADLQALMASYADQLRKEGLDTVVGVADIMSGLEQTLSAGLQGQAANAFAYLATKLNAAIPTQDFFQYAEDYAQFIANATKEGKSQAQAIEYANAQLEAFAGTIAFTSRQITNGVATGLKDAQSLFDDAVKIAQTARTNNATQIASVLATVSGVVGATAPGLANEIVDAVVKAATGGNASELVALRSLAGINASNTEFLQMFARNPQAIFGQVFEGLAEKQHMSDTAYMEVAEGLSSVFGVSMDALARVDFNYLAQTIRSLSVNDSDALGALAENYEQLMSGETTTNAEMVRIAQANQYALTEGLSLVLDNEVTRSIQQHMWDQEIAEKLMTAQYAVDLAGSANKMMTGIINALDNVLNVLTFGLYRIGRGIVNVVGTGIDIGLMQQELSNIIAVGQVKQLNAQQQSAFLTNMYMRTLVNIATDSYTMEDSYLKMLVRVSSSEPAKTIKAVQAGMSAIFGTSPAGLMTNLAGALGGVATPAVRSGSSKYQWGGIVGKSMAQLSPLVSDMMTTSAGEMSAAAGGTEAAGQQLSRAAQAIQDWVTGDFIKTQYVDQGKEFSDWLQGLADKNIADVDAVLEELDTSKDDIQQLFKQSQSEKAAEDAKARNDREEEFWKFNNEFVQEGGLYVVQLHSELEAQTTTITTKLDAVIAAIETVNTTNGNIGSKVKSFYDAWVAYFVDHTAYNAGVEYSALTRVLDDSKREPADAVNALSDVLLNALSPENMKDPQIQTNVLLAQILQILTALMQQGAMASSGGSMLSDTLLQLAFGNVTNIGSGFTGAKT